MLPALKDIDYIWSIKDNNSTDGSIELIDNWNNSKVHVMKCTHNRDTFSYGCNILFNEIEHKDDDHILLLNNDIVIKDDKSIRTMINFLNKDSSIGVIGAKLCYQNTSIIQHAGIVFDNNHQNPINYRAGDKVDKRAEQNRLFQAVTGAMFITTAACYKNAYTENKSGLLGLDENFIWCFDDVDFCLSIKYNLKKKILYCGEVSIDHEESVSLKQNPIHRLYMHHNVAYYRRKWSNIRVIDRLMYDKDPKYNLYKGKK